MDGLEKWRASGAIASKVREYGKSLVKPGKSVLEITEAIERKIEELGAKPAFPPQLSLNNAAAHECADPDDERILKDELVKVDVGVHLDGFMSDNATTVDLSGKHGELIEAAQAALEAAIMAVKPGVKVREIGAIIGDTISLRGYEPIRNLSGHGLDKYTVHAPPSVPNYDTGDTAVLKKGMIIAIEPFATTGQGWISEKGPARVFMQSAKKPVRDPYSREILPTIEAYNGLPFSRRWLLQKHAKAKVDFALRQLQAAGIVHAFPPLVEAAGTFVAQAEHSVYVDETPIVLTR